MIADDKHTKWISDQSQIQFESEIFQKSKCLFHEETLAHFISSQLLVLGYRKIYGTDVGITYWEKQGKKVVICLVDDFTVNDPNRPIIDEDTIVITDNIYTGSRNYSIITVPTSFIGIYAYEPTKNNIDIDKSIFYGTNRIDQYRIVVLLELLRKYDNKVNDLLINFNAKDYLETNPIKAFQKIFKNELDIVVEEKKSLLELYQKNYDFVLKNLPFKNYTDSFDHIAYRAACSIVVETYINDKNLTLSEKTFRALVTPRPFVLHASQNACAHLRSLGFRFFNFAIDHEVYDTKSNDNIGIFTKPKHLIDVAMAIAKEVKKHKSLIKIAEKDAIHNMSVLLRFRQQWPTDFISWWQPTLEKLR